MCELRDLRENSLRDSAGNFFVRAGNFFGLSDRSREFGERVPTYPSTCSRVLAMAQRQCLFGSSSAFVRPLWMKRLAPLRGRVRHGRARMGLFVKLEFCIFSAAALFSVGLA